MIIPIPEADVLMSDNFEELSFEIDSNSDAMIFDILRNKLYKNKIGAISREIACNGRDSHREAQVPDKPLEIEIQDYRNAEFIEDGVNIIFRDFGTGISPEKIYTVYRKYGASTRTGSNEMTGGFGLGAKTPFAYADAFTVKTIVGEIEYSYAIYIDPSRKGKIALINEQVAYGKSNMTEVIIPIKNSEDLAKFEKEVIVNTFFWAVRPKLIGFNTSYERLNKAKFLGQDIETQDFFVIETMSSGKLRDNVSAIIDGIYYPIDCSLINFNNSVQCLNICLNFKNGDLVISANRENLQYEPETINLINKKLNSVFVFLNEIFEKSISDANTFYEACMIYNHALDTNDLFNASIKGKKPRYISKTGEVLLLENMSNRLKTIDIVHLSSSSSGRLTREKDLRLNSKHVRKNFNKNIYFLNPNEKLKATKNRTILKDNEEFVIFQRKKLDEYNSILARSHQIDLQQFVRERKAEEKRLQKIGFNISNYIDIPDTKAEPVAKKKNVVKSVTVKILDKYSSVYNDNFILNEKGLIPKKNGPYTNLYFEIYDKLDSKTEIDLSLLNKFIVNNISNKVRIIIIGLNKLKYVKGLMSLQDFLFFNRNKIMEKYSRTYYSDILYKLNNFNGLKIENNFVKKIKPLLELNKITKTMDTRTVEFIRHNVKKIVFIPKKYDHVFDEVLLAYPILFSIDGLKQRQEYINLVDELNKYKKQENGSI